MTIDLLCFCILQNYNRWKKIKQFSLLVDVLLSNFILVADYTHGRILQICLQTGTVVKLPIKTKQVHGLTFDKSTKTLFYSELSTNSISYTTLHGKNTTVLYTTGLILKILNIKFFGVEVRWSHKFLSPIYFAFW